MPAAICDPGRYFVSFFGLPGAAAPWGWRFEGHHVSLHFTLAGETLLGLTPNFLGSNPARVGHGGQYRDAPSGRGGGPGAQLLLSLDADQRALRDHLRGRAD